MPRNLARCSFCNKGAREIKGLVPVKHGHICEECAETAAKLLAEDGVCIDTALLCPLAASEFIVHVLSQYAGQDIGIETIELAAFLRMCREKELDTRADLNKAMLDAESAFAKAVSTARRLKLVELVTDPEDPNSQNYPLSILDRQVCEQYDAFPISLGHDNVLTVAIADPSSVSTISALEANVAPCKVTFCVAVRRQIRMAIYEHYDAFEQRAESETAAEEVSPEDVVEIAPDDRVSRAMAKAEAEASQSDPKLPTSTTASSADEDAAVEAMFDDAIIPPPPDEGDDSDPDNPDCDA